MQENFTPEVANPAPAPLILSNLPDVLGETGDCPRRTRTQLDLLMLAIEALDLTGSEAILAVAEELELQSVIQNRVALWRLRSTNPMRKMSQRRGMSLTEAKALIAIPAWPIISIATSPCFDRGCTHDAQWRCMIPMQP
jgi:hypothetical protein